ncbi:vesicle-associated membrane protein 7 [Acrasis kona]|uniref:Vesicle-associated membrane protein 7 n=1 Tax=Acrasis kona TaxID=1008807 RepID=A0AAW2YIX7_9EUKA
MAIIYALVAHTTTILAEHTQQKGNFQQISKQILEKLPTNNTKVSYLYDNYMFHICVDKGYTFFCMSEKDFGNRIPFEFLEDIKQRFHQSYGDKAQTAAAFSLNGDFGRILQRQMEYFSNSEESDKLTKVKGKIQQVKDIMIDNIDKVLERGEKIDLLVDRTADLSETAQHFRYKSKKLKTTMWWRNVKLIAILIIVILIVLFGVIWLICGIPDFDKCRQWTSTNQDTSPPSTTQAPGTPSPSI